MKKVVTALSLGALVAIGGGAQANEVTVKVAQIQALTWAAWMGLPKTMTVDGTKVTIEPSGFKSSADVMLAVQTGQIDIGPTALGVVASALAATKNVPMKMVAGVGDGTTAVVVTPKSGITQLADLKGKRIGAVRGSNEFFKLQVTLASIGSDIAKDTQLTMLSAPTDQILALQRGDLDAIVTYAPFTTQAVKAGGIEAPKINQILVHEAGIPTVIIANNDFLAKQPKAAQAIIDAYVQNWRRFDSDRAFWVDTYLKSASGDRPLLLDAVASLPANQWLMKEEAMLRIIRNLAHHKAIPADTGADTVKLLDYTYLAKATGQSPKELGQR
ncbi:MAG: ABC transporter substrate-binding protein [Alphaproteobacteria bacterium]